MGEFPYVNEFLLASSYECLDHFCLLCVFKVHINPLQFLSFLCRGTKKSSFTIFDLLHSFWSINFNKKSTLTKPGTWERIDFTQQRK